jgi:hypothetical protein
VTIRRGEPWGEPGALAADACVVADDRAVASAVAAGATEVGIVGGDVHRTLGSPRRDADDLHRGRGVRFPLDVVEVRATRPDGSVLEDVAVAHLIVRGRSMWGGPTLVVMNAAFAGDRNLGPRAHPNDGRLDVTIGSLPWSDRRAARARMRTGTHVPHPALEERRVRELHHELARPRRLWLDGTPVGEVVAIAVTCRSDAVVVVA